MIWFKQYWASASSYWRRRWTTSVMNRALYILVRYWLVQFSQQSCTYIQGGKRDINPFQPWVRCIAKSGPIIYWYGFSLTVLFSNSAHFKYHSAKYWGQLILGFNIKYSWVYEIYCIWVIPPRGGISLCQYTFCTTELYCVLCTMYYVLCTVYVLHMYSVIWNWQYVTDSRLKAFYHF